MLRGRGRTGVSSHPLIVVQSRLLVRVIGLVLGKTACRAVETVEHVVQCGLDVVTSVHDRPADADVLWRVIRVHSEAQ